MFTRHRRPQLLRHLPELAVPLRRVAWHHWRPPPRPALRRGPGRTSRGAAGRMRQASDTLRTLPGSQGTARVSHTANRAS